DLEMLRNGPYPWMVKQRVMSRVGHLSNAALADFFEKDYDGQAAFLVLAHLSEHNNHPELAREAAYRALGGKMNLFQSCALSLAQQDKPLQPLCLGREDKGEFARIAMIDKDRRELIAAAIPVFWQFLAVFGKVGNLGNVTVFRQGDRGHPGRLALRHFRPSPGDARRLRTASGGVCPLPFPAGSAPHHRYRAHDRGYRLSLHVSRRLWRRPSF